MPDDERAGSLCTIERWDEVVGEWVEIDHARSSRDAWARIGVYTIEDVSPARYRVVTLTIETEPEA